MNDLLDGNKVLSIADKNASTPEFIAVIEKEKAGLKLYYYMWLARLFIFFAVVSLLIFMSFSLSLFRLAPQVTVEPFLIINQDSSEGIVRYEPISQDMASKDKLLEIFIRQYILLRNTVVSDSSEMASRWFYGGIINFLSSDEVFYNFNKATQATFADMINSQYTREVEITSFARVGGKKSRTWKIDFKTYDLTPSVTDTSGMLKLQTRYWTASLSAVFIPERMFMGRRLLNPLGFTVIRYSQAEVSI